MLSQETIKSLYTDAVTSVSADISSFSSNPGRDFTRSRKLPADTLMFYLISQGSSNTGNELMDFFGMDVSAPSESALIQQRAKLKPEALENVFLRFNSSLFASEPAEIGNVQKYRYLATDGSTATFPSSAKFSPDEYYSSPGNSINGAYSIHINVLYDLEKRIYTDAVLQPVREKDEFEAFCQMVDSHAMMPGEKDIFIGDRGYASYNNMAHVIEKGQFFLFRTKDLSSKGLAKNFEYPDSDEFDTDVDVTLARSHLKQLIPEKGYFRYIDSGTSFDYIKRGTKDTYKMSFRIVRFALSENTYELLLTNLPRDEFPPERLKEVYFSRWGVETSFRKLKYTIGLANFHSYKPDCVKQEIWAQMIAYNITETLINNTVLEQENGKYAYKIEFSSAAHICRAFLRNPTEECRIDVMALLQKRLIPIRDERQYARLQTAHFRRPRHFLYRAA